MDDTNEIIGSLDFSEAPDPLNIAPPDDSVRQAEVADRITSTLALRSVNYETLPLYIKNFLIAILVDMFRQDRTFTYDDDEAKTQVIISSAWLRGVIESRDIRPKVIVSFQGAGPENLFLRDQELAQLPSRGVTSEIKSWLDTLSFRITVIHWNYELCCFLGGQLRARVATSIPSLQEVFGLQKVFPPSLSGPGQLEEYDDLYGCFVDFKAQVFPRWELTDKPDFIRRIIAETIGTTERLLEGAIIETQTVIRIGHGEG